MVNMIRYKYFALREQAYYCYQTNMPIVMEQIYSLYPCHLVLPVRKESIERVSDMLYIGILYTFV